MFKGCHASQVTHMKVKATSAVILLMPYSGPAISATAAYFC